MPTVKEDLARMKKELREEGNSLDDKDLRKNSHQISMSFSELYTLMLLNYGKEFEIAKKARLLEITHHDNDWTNTEYKMEGIPDETLIREYC